MDDNQINPIVLKYHDKQSFIIDDCFPFNKVSYTRIVILPNSDDDTNICDFIVLIYPANLNFGRRIGGIHNSNIENGTGINKETMKIYSDDIIKKINNGFLIPYIENCIENFFIE
jgi:hypothetical protein